MGNFLKERLLVFAIFAAIFLAWQGLRLAGIRLDPVYPLLAALAAWLVFVFWRARNR